MRGRYPRACLLTALTVSALVAGTPPAGATRMGVPASAQVAAAPPPVWAPGCDGEPTGWSQHPSRIGLTCDSVSIIVGVRWHHWGQATANATGTLEAATSCKPNCAEAPRRHYHVTITASHIGYCGTRRVYGQITVRYTEAGHHKTFTQPTVCTFAGERPASSPAPSTPSNPANFQVHLATGSFLCGITLTPPGGEGIAAAGGAFCLSHGSPTAENNWYGADVQADGQVTSCSEETTMMRSDCYRGQGEDIYLPYLAPGQQSTVGPMTCKVLENGVECTVTATGKGFRITPESVSEVGE